MAEPWEMKPVTIRKFFVPPSMCDFPDGCDVVIVNDCIVSIDPHISLATVLRGDFPRTPIPETEKECHALARIGR